jgi:hypothetical protein
MPMTAVLFPSRRKEWKRAPAVSRMNEREEPDMITDARRLMATLLAFALLLGPVPAARAATPPGESEGVGSTPPRLSYATGEVSFWRPGAADWAPAQINTPLAPGDELYTGNQGNLELQVGPRAFVRAWGDTQLGLANQEPDFLQLKVTSGHASIDLRNLEPGRTVEMDTPHGAFLIEHPGYYRADVTEQRTAFSTRRGGRATVTAPGGQAVAIAPNQAVILEGAPTPTMQSYAAPELDTWDRWNYARTDQLIATASARYVPADVYGVRELDQYGSWRTVEMYGSVWVPAGVQAGWVPYSTGRWIWDPFYGWTWVDTAPWGWAPYHYGRWVFVSGYWAWAPGPIVVRPVYAPALVVFFGAPGIHVSIGAPLVSWVALGWGEPVVPWWGRPGFVGRPWWGSWGGPRVVNNVVVNQTTVVNVNTITVYRNSGIQNAVVAVPQDRFGRASVREARVAPGQIDVRRLEPVRGELRVAPAAASFVAASGKAAPPPEAALARPVVATRPHATRSIAPRTEGQTATPVVSAPAQRIVPVPKTARTAPESSQPLPAASTVERPRQQQPQRSDTTQRPDAGPAAPREWGRRQDAAPPPPRGQQRGPEATPPAENRGAVEPKRQPPSPGRQETAPPPARGQQRGPEATAPPEPRGNQERGNQVRGPEATAPSKNRRPVEPPPASAPAAPAPAPQRVEPPRPSPQPAEPANKLGQGTQISPSRPAPGPVAAPHPAPPPPPSQEQGQRKDKERS